MLKVHKKSTTQGVELVLLGMEAQEHVHYAMPMRVMGYDYSAYKRQYNINAQKHKENKTLQGDEYLSGMKKEDKFIPVITVVVYYGEKPWDGAVSLWGILNLPEQMKKFVNDYKMSLVEARKNNLVLVDKAVVMTVAGATNNRIDFDMLGKKGDADMCTVFEATWAEGRAEGIIETSLDCGLSEGDILAKLQEKLNIPLQKAQEYFDLYAKQTV